MTLPAAPWSMVRPCCPPGRLHSRTSVGPFMGVSLSIFSTTYAPFPPPPLAGLLGQAAIRCS
eukprot:15984676-Heterocapsa_arctica.AAC.1